MKKYLEFLFGAIFIVAFFTTTNSNLTPNLALAFPQFLDFSSDAIWFVVGTGVVTLIIGLPLSFYILKVLWKDVSESALAESILRFVLEVSIGTIAFSFLYSSEQALLYEIFLCFTIAVGIESSLCFFAAILTDEPTESPVSSNYRSEKINVQVQSGVPSWQSVTSYIAAGISYQLLVTGAMLGILFYANINFSVGDSFALLTSCGFGLILLIILFGPLMLWLGKLFLSPFEDSFSGNKTYEGTCFGLGFGMTMMCLCILTIYFVDFDFSMSILFGSLMIMVVCAALTGIPFGLLREGKPPAISQMRLQAIFN